MARSPIEHVVIILKENHTFDNYFGRFPGADGDVHLAKATDPPASDPPHDRKAWLRRRTRAIHAGYSEADIPEYWSLARQYTLCDRYFTDVAGPSTPNHLMLIAADSPLIDNFHRRDRSQPVPPYDLPSLPAALERAGRGWTNYGGFAFEMITDLKGSPRSVKASRFARDAATGHLPDVSWVFAPPGLDEHPVSSVAAGATWTADQVAAVVKGGLWPTTAIFITWDDWGGWSDHVNPPSLEPWTDGFQFRLGSRVPCLVVSPYARTGYVSRVQRSHVSLMRFVEDLFGVPPINRRDAAADGMADCFDLTRQPAPPPRQGGPLPPPSPAPPRVPPPPPAAPDGPNPSGLHFIITSDAGAQDGCRFELRAHDGTVIARSEVYATKEDCRMTIDFLRRAVDAADVADHTAASTEVTADRGEDPHPGARASP